MITECSNPTIECPKPSLWHMYDDNSCEVEVLQFLGQLVQTVKPNLVVETGTHLGYSAMFIGNALRDNGFGKLITCEIQPDHFDSAQERLMNARLFDFVEARLGSSLAMQVPGTIDLLFCDSSPAIRLEEIEHFWDKLSPQSLILVHDVNTDCHKQLREKVLDCKKLSSVMLPTPRGLAICQKAAGR